MDSGKTPMGPRDRATTRVLVAGCGGIGGVVASQLHRHGFDVTAISHNTAIRDAILENGLAATVDRVTHRSDIRTVVHADDLGDERFDLALLAVPPDAVLEAGTSVLPFLTDEALVVPFANGLPEEQLGEVIDQRRILGGIVSFGASMLRPGHVEQTSKGGFTLGRIADSASDADLNRVASILEHIGPVQRASNLRGARWSKLAINCAISPLQTIGGARLGVLMRQRYVRRLTLEAMTEVVAVSRHAGVALEKVAGTLDLDWLALDEDERMRQGSPALVAKHAVLLAVGAKYRRMRSSMLRALERGRKPPVEQLNGEVTRRGLAAGIPTPINQALLDTVLDIAAGNQRPGIDTLERFYASTRPQLREMRMIG